MKIYLTAQFIWVLQNQYKVFILVLILQQELHTHLLSAINQSSLSRNEQRDISADISAMWIILLYGVGGISTQNLE